MNVKDKIRGYRTMLGLNQSEMGRALELVNSLIIIRKMVKFLFQIAKNGIQNVRTLFF